MDLLARQLKGYKILTAGLVFLVLVSTFLASCWLHYCFSLYLDWLNALMLESGLRETLMLPLLPLRGIWEYQLQGRTSF